MFTNPFSPIFGGKPGVFFGRTDILRRFDLAMVDQGSEDRAMFFTGTRGCGKTALLEQLSIRADARKRIVIDLGPEDTIEQLVHELAGFDERTDTISPQAAVSVFGMGAGISAGSVSKTRKIGRESLQPLLLEACRKAGRGILVTIDEVQKVSLDDVSALGNAFQMASRKGYDIMLAVAGLPYAYTSIIRHEGCTYLRRASREELGLFTWEETEKAFFDAFSGINGISVSREFIDRLNQASYGHPYLMQLLGYHLMIQVNENAAESPHTVTEQEMENAIANALLTYEQRALKPLLEELPASERKYLSAVSACLGEDRLAAASDVAGLMGLAQNRLSKKRATLIDYGILAAPEHGKIMFCIPYLADFVKKKGSASSVIEIARKRRV